MHVSKNQRGRVKLLSHFRVKPRFVFMWGFCPSRSVSQEPCIIWLSFMLHLCKMIIFPGNFFIFSKFWFFGLLAGKSAKNSPKGQNILSVALPIWGTIHHMTVIYICKMIISSDVFFILKILIFLVCRGIKRQKTVQNDKKLSVTLHISGTIISFMVQMCETIISPVVFFSVKIVIFQVVKWKGKKSGRKSVQKKPTVKRYLLILDLKPFRS